MKVASGVVYSATWPAKRAAAAFAAAGIAAIGPAAAGTPSAGWLRTAAPMESPTRQASEDTIVLVCRKAPVESMAPMNGQDIAQNPPMICLAAPGAVLAMGPARFHELLDKAASSGAMVVFVMQPQ